MSGVSHLLVGILCGDFNARTGNLKDYITNIDGTSERQNIDQRINANGEDLIDFIKDCQLAIVNGRCGMNDLLALNITVNRR